jgi:hypothetical protein
MSKKMVLEFFRVYDNCLDDNPKTLFSQYKSWSKKAGCRRVSFRTFLFLLNKYLEEQSIKTSKS